MKLKGKSTLTGAVWTKLDEEGEEGRESFKTMQEKVGCNNKHCDTTKGTDEFFFSSPLVELACGSSCFKKSQDPVKMM